MCSLTSQGHVYQQFQHALTRGHVAAAWAAAHELPHVSLADALSLCLLLRDREPKRYGPAAVRWLGRFCLEAQSVSLDELGLVFSGLIALRGDGAVGAAQALGQLFDVRGDRELAKVLRRWQVELAPSR